jgi:streptogramin lyase
VWSSGTDGVSGVDVVLVDGETGVIEQTVHIPEIVPNYYGIYGAAVDSEGNFWGSQLGGGKLAYVDIEDFQYQLWDIPISSYGMTVDHQGYVWVCSNDVARFDPMTQTWQTATTGGSGGCMEDGAGTLWQASSSLVGVDTQTLTVVKTIPIPNYVHGVSIDFYGYVWGVTLQQPYAYRCDPATMVCDTFTGLNGPYTYSDMTGFALKNAGHIPNPAG